MAASVRASSVLDSSATRISSLVANKPTGTAENDVLVAFVAFEGNRGVSGAPSGWTQREDSASSNVDEADLVVYTKVAGASEPSTYTWTLNSTAYSIVTIFAVQDAVDYDVSAITLTTEATLSDPETATSPTVTTTNDNALVLLGWACKTRDKVIAATHPSGTTEETETLSADTNELHGGSAYFTQVTAGATGTKDWSLDLALSDTGGHATATIAIQNLGTVEPSAFSPPTTFGTTEVKRASVNAVAADLGPSFGETVVYDPDVLLPVATVEVAFDANPEDADPLTWTDITPYVTRVSGTRGKSRTLARFEAGSLTVEVNNQDRRFDPTYESSPYGSDGVRPLRPIRVTASWRGVVYTLFRGFVLSWPTNYPSSHDSRTIIQAVDGWALFRNAAVTATRAQETTQARIGAVLDAMSWPTGLRDLNGSDSVQATTLTDEEALGHLQLVETTDDGFLYVASDGSLTFIDRDTFVSATLDETNYTFGDQAGEHRFLSIKTRYDEIEIYNHIVASREGGSTAEVEQAGSISRYFRRTLTRSGLLHTDDTETTNYANALLDRFVEPALVIDAISLRLTDGSDSTRRILDRDLTDKVKVAFQPVDGQDGATGRIEQSSYIIGIRFDIEDGAKIWDLSWMLSPLDREGASWILGESVLGTDTELGF